MTQEYAMHAMMAYELEDAKEALEAAMALFEPNKDVDEEEFERHMAHMFSHVNTAWNVRNLSFDQFDSANEESREQWTEFPSDIIPN